MNAMTNSIRIIARGALFAAFISTFTVLALAMAPTAGQVASIVTRPDRPVQVLPVALRPVLYRTLAKDSGPVYRIAPNGCATLPQQSLRACFDNDGVRFTGAAMPVSLHLAAYGRGRDLAPVTPVRPAIDANRVSYAHGNLTEWWRVLPVGFEQGFTIAKRPAGQGELVFALSASRRDAGAPSFRHSPESGNPVEKNIPTSGRDANSYWIPASTGMTKKEGVFGWGKLRYGQLVVTDAKGKVIPAALKTKGDKILIAVNDAHAAYPLTVDPLVWLEQEVTASDGAANDQFGFKVAVDGTTAFIGAPFATVNGTADAGAVYVFSESNGAWTQTQKLTASDASSILSALFGWGLALHGTTALISAPQATVEGNLLQGEAYFFTESDGIWIQTQAVTASDAMSFGDFGEGVALGNDVAFVSAGNDFVNGTPVPGSVYVFTESDDPWTQTQKILSPNPAGDAFGVGANMGISDTTAVVGAFSAPVNGNENEGNATVYTEADGTWTETQQLTASDGGANNLFGVGVAIQGNTILIGAESANGTGAAYVFTNSGDAWTQTQELSADDGVSGDRFGSFTALDGTTAFIGAEGYNSGEGKAYLFTNSNGNWAQTQELIPSDPQTGGFFGLSGALSMPTALTGALGVTVSGNALQGAAYFYGASDLGLNVSAPQTVGQGQQYVSQTIATNNASTASPAVTATVSVPAAASFVSATATRGTCSENSGVVTCDFGAIDGNAGTATADVTLKATGSPGITIENTASIAKATPALSASAPTTITAGDACPDGYTAYDGSLNPGEVARSPVYQAPGGEENAILTAPERFQLYAVYQSGRYGRHVYRVPGNEVHRWGLKGLYMWLVRARDSAGAYTLCLQHP